MKSHFECCTWHRRKVIDKIRTRAVQMEGEIVARKRTNIGKAKTKKLIN